MTGLIIGAALAVLAGAAEADPTPITASGWGAVRVGMSVPEAVSAMKGALKISEGFFKEDGCRYMESRAAPGLMFMVEGERIVRIETYERKYSTPSGIRVGDRESAVRRIFGRRVQVKPHQYVETGHYLVVAMPGGKHGVVIETTDGKVKSIRGGEFPAVEYVEGCS